KNVVDAGNRHMTPARFRADFDRVRENLQEQAGRPVSTQDMVNENLHVRFIEGRTRELGFLSWAWDAGLRPGKALIVKQMREIPAFFNQVTGQFDEVLYEQTVLQRGTTP